MKASVNTSTVLPYLLAVVVMYLAGSYLGDLFVYLFVFSVTLPLLSLLHLLIVFCGIRVEQRFVESVPVRRQEITCSAWIGNDSYLPAPRVQLQLILSYPGSDRVEQELGLTLPARGGFTYRTGILCSHRGNYTVGFDGFCLTDLLGWITLCRSLDRSTFAVYPRVIRVNFAAGAGREGIASGYNRFPGRVVDPTLLRGLAEYRRNEPVKHIAWRKFAAHGIPYVREYESGQQPTTVVYIDLRAIDSPRALDVDDCSVEILVAVVKSLVEAGILVEIHGNGVRRYDATVTTRSQFREFILSTRRIEFGGNCSPAALIASSSQQRSDRPEAALVITHRMDEEVMALFHGGGHAQASGIMNMVANSETEKQRIRRIAHQARLAGGVIHLVEDVDHISEAILV
jgi:uncharacterized protein (DUF58 family)